MRATTLVVLLSASTASITAACAPRGGRATNACPCTCASSSSSPNAIATAAPSFSATPVGSIVAGDPDDALQVASEHSAAGDGKGCLEALDKFDATSKHPSTNPLTNAAYLRAHCTLLAGQCQKGKQLLEQMEDARKSYPPGQREKMIETVVITTCRNPSDLSPREQFLQAEIDLQQGAYVSKKSTNECAAAWETANKLQPWMQPQGDDDTMVKEAPHILVTAGPGCFANAGDCATAKKIFYEQFPKAFPKVPNDPKTMDTTYRSIVAKCKDVP